MKNSSYDCKQPAIKVQRDEKSGFA